MGNKKLVYLSIKTKKSTIFIKLQYMNKTYKTNIKTTCINSSTHS